MTKKKGSRKKIVVATILVLIAAMGIIVWHDGVIGVTSIADINAGNIDNGTAVTVKGELVFRAGNLHTVKSTAGDNIVIFEWAGSSPPLGSIVVVRGVVSSIGTLSDVTSVAVVWIVQ
jgi:hypothetical protein